MTATQLLSTDDDYFQDAEQDLETVIAFLQREFADHPTLESRIAAARRAPREQIAVAALQARSRERERAEIIQLHQEDERQLRKSAEPDARLSSADMQGQFAQLPNKLVRDTTMPAEANTDLRKFPDMSVPQSQATLR
jgi:hypothetical protein